MEVEFILRLILAAAFGGLVGIEREKKKRPAGLRTHMMVCLGAALLTVMSFYPLADSGLDFDASRIAAAIVMGIGFLGAGAILRGDNGDVSGLTTASSIWLVAAIGMALGFGMYMLATVTLILALVILFVLEKVNKR